MMHVVRTSPIALGFGAIFGLIIAMSLPGLYDYGREQYEAARPVVRDWTVTDNFTDGDDVVLSGTMRKVRDCVYLPPTLARDDGGQNYTVTSTSPTAGRTWDASTLPQHWGPWRVSGGAGKRLSFIVVYMCGGSYPTIIELGSHGPTK